MKNVNEIIDALWHVTLTQDLIICLANRSGSLMIFYFNILNNNLIIKSHKLSTFSTHLTELEKDDAKNKSGWWKF